MQNGHHDLLNTTTSADSMCAVIFRERLADADIIRAAAVAAAAAAAAKHRGGRHPVDAAREREGLRRWSETAIILSARRLVIFMLERCGACL